MTRDEFIAAYCQRSGVAWGELKHELAALPCACGADNCEGWAMVPFNGLAIDARGPSDMKRFQFECPNPRCRNRWDWWLSCPNCGADPEPGGAA